MQRRLQQAVTLTGIGLHSGAPACLVVRPAPADHGIVFVRVDVSGSGRIPARYDLVSDTRLCTRLSNAEGVSVSTIEHLMAALAGCGVHNALIEIDGPEVPIMDGSAAPFVRAFVAAGFVQEAAPLRAIRILKPVAVTQDGFEARLVPLSSAARSGLEIDFSIAFAEKAIGAQAKALNMANGSFIRELSDSRTFCLLAEVETMRAHGLARGGSLENAVVFHEGSVMNPEGLRHTDECVRHKMLDALGDLALAGAPILGRYIGNKAGHQATNLLLRALFARPDAYELVECDAALAQYLPGASLSARDWARIAA